jgi:uncharacterized protein (DUF1499 family)
MFAGSRPPDLGLRDGKLRGGDWRPNWVSSQVPASDGKHYIDPISFDGEAAAAWSGLERAILAEPRSAIVTRKPAYLHAQFASAMMGFLDDAEFALDAAAGMIHVRAGARLGIRDFGVNRDRIERLRRAMGAAGPPSRR